MTGPAATRGGAERFGRRAEAWCRLALRLKGYRVLAARQRTPVGEIDIVARRGGVVAIVEVKARRAGADMAEAVSPRQRARLERAAAAYLGRHAELAGLAVRFDVMLVRPWRWPEHVCDAWRP
ncbi:MAG: YraN family protein [Rhodospirillaceae bacterium]